jgi:group I intron endonuclease
MEAMVKTMETYGIIYKITNTINGKIYIGQTIQTLKQRKKDHRNCMERLKHLALYRAFRKHGFEKFDWTIIYYAKDKNDLDETEKYYIKFFKTMSPKHGYNMTYGGEGGQHPIEIKQKISKSLQGRIFSDETRKKLSLSLKGKYTKERSSWWGRKHTDDERKKIGDAQKGDKNHMYGKKATAETRKKMSASHKGELHWNHKKVICVNTKVVYISAIDASEKTGVDNSSIGKCCKGQRNNAGGFRWEYID